MQRASESTPLVEPLVEGDRFSHSDPSDIESGPTFWQSLNHTLNPWARHGEDALHPTAVASGALDLAGSNRRSSQDIHAERAKFLGLPIRHLPLPEFDKLIKGHVDQAKKDQFDAIIKEKLEEGKADLALRPEEFDQVHINQAMYRGTATITFRDVGFAIQVKDPETKQKVEKVLLEPLSGVIKPAELVALMGPSGCGKSTLLDIIADKKTGKYMGEVFVNGRPRGKLFDQVTAYVGQADVMPERWYVREAVAFNAMLRRPRIEGMPLTSMKPSIDILLAALGLDHIADTYIGGPTVRGISGGQRRRVSLARGLASGPNVLFADEPTSGLSSTDAEMCVKRLKMIALKFGIAIVIVIHQPKPEVAALFDKLILLTSQPGRCVYNGPMKDAFKYYEKVGYPVPAYANPADHFLDMITPNVEMAHPDEFVAYYQKHLAPSNAAEVDASLATPGLSEQQIILDKYERIEHLFGAPTTASKRNLQYTASFFFQFKVVFMRTVTLKLRDVQGLVMETVQALVKGVLLGIAFFGIGSEYPTFQLSFIFLLCQMAVISLLQNMGALIEGRTIMKYEVSDKLYRDEAYILSISTIDLFKFVINYLIYLIIALSMAGMPWDHFSAFLGWSLLTLIAMDSFFQMMAAIGKSMPDAQVKAMPYLILCMLFNGYFVTLNTVAGWMKWAIYCSPLYYFIQAVAIANFDTGQPCDALQPDYPNTGPCLIANYGFKSMQGASIAILLGFVLLFRVMQVICLKNLNNIER